MMIMSLMELLKYRGMELKKTIKINKFNIVYILKQS